MKVWSTGCSWTSGVGLQDCATESYDVLVMENIFPNHYNYWNFRFSDAGHSNQYIFRMAIEIAEKMNKEEDVLLVQWTSPFRQEIVTDEGYAFYSPYDFVCLKFLYGNRLENLKENKDEIDLKAVKKYKKAVESFTENFTNKDYMELMSFNMQVSLYHFLKSLGIKSIQFYGWEGCRIESKNIYNFIPENENFLKESFQSVINDNGMYLVGNDHPNKEGHKVFSEFLIKKMKQLNYI